MGVPRETTNERNTMQSISKRDYFAGLAMQAMVSCSSKTNTIKLQTPIAHDENDVYTQYESTWPDIDDRVGEIEEIASLSYSIADAMIKY